LAGRLAGKRILVTAAAQGIGRASAAAFAREGARVIATDVAADKLSALAGPGLETRRLDVLDGAAIEALAKELGALDVLMNCAGYVHHGTVLDTSDKDWDFSFDLNVRAMFRVCRAFLPAMIQKGGGTVVNVASVAGSLKGIANRFAYGASKGAVIGLTKAIAADLVGKNVRCNALCPGTVDTPSLHERVAAQGGGEAIWKAFIARQPAGRLGTAEEMADAAIYLASDESRFMTGQTLIVDGGIMI